MELNNHNLLYMDESFLDSYTPFTHNELQVLYRFLKRFQIEQKLSVSIPYRELRNTFSVNDESFLIILCRFLATAPTKPVYIGCEDNRRVVYLVRHGELDQKKGVATVEFDEVVRDYFLCPGTPAVVNLDIISRFPKEKDGFCDGIKIYQYLSNEYSKKATGESLYVACTIETLYFISSTFEWLGGYYEEKYLNNGDLREMAKEITEELNYKSKRYFWYVFRNSFVTHDIDIMNQFSDIFIEGCRIIQKGPRTVGVIFKIRRNDFKGNLNYLQELYKPSDNDVILQKNCDTLYNKKG